MTENLMTIKGMQMMISSGQLLTKRTLITQLNTRRRTIKAISHQILKSMSQKKTFQSHFDSEMTGLTYPVSCLNALFVMKNGTPVTLGLSVKARSTMFLSASFPQNLNVIIFLNALNVKKMKNAKESLAAKSMENGLPGFSLKNARTKSSFLTIASFQNALDALLTSSHAISYLSVKMSSFPSLIALTIQVFKNLDMT